MNTLEQLIKQHQLQPHPEGGWFRELHRGNLQVQRGDGARRSGLTAILFLLPEQAFSCWHRVLGADEAWTQIAGDPLELLQCRPNGEDLLKLRLSTEAPLHVVPADHWQAARSTGRYSLVSCCVGPGFDFADFEMLRQRPLKDRPVLAHPELI